MSERLHADLDRCRDNAAQLKALNDPSTRTGRAQRREADHICDVQATLTNTMDDLARNEAAR